MTEDAKAKAESLGFSYWPGGDAAPADWDGGEALHDDGTVYPAHSYQWKWGWPHNSARQPGDIIGYHKRTPAAATPADTVQIARMTETEAQSSEALERFRLPNANWIAGWMAAHRALDLIRPETTAERFTRETGHELPSDLTPEMRALIEAALAWEQGK